MADVFVSYKKEDINRINPLVKGLEANGFTVWWDYQIETGTDWWESIVKEISIARCVVGCWSINSVRENKAFASNYVSEEHDLGASKLAPVLFDEGRIPVPYKHVEAANLIDWSGDQEHGEWRNLLTRIERLATPNWVTARFRQQEAMLQIERDRWAAAESLSEALKQQLESAARISSTSTNIPALTESYASQRRYWELIVPDKVSGFVSWVYSIGEYVTKGTTIAQIRSLSTTHRLLAPVDGKIKKIVVESDRTASGNDLIGVFEAETLV
jgi:biotin carboxyl carrier protein